MGKYTSQMRMKTELGLIDIVGRSGLSKPANTLFRHNLTGVLEAAIRASNAQYDDPSILARLDVRLLEVRQCLFFFFNNVLTTRANEYWGFYRYHRKIWDGMFSRWIITLIRLSIPSLRHRRCSSISRCLISYGDSSVLNIHCRQLGEDW